MLCQRRESLRYHLPERLAIVRRAEKIVPLPDPHPEAIAAALLRTSRDDPPLDQAAVALVVQYPNTLSFLWKEPGVKAVVFEQGIESGAWVDWLRTAKIADGASAPLTSGEHAALRICCSLTGRMEIVLASELAPQRSSALNTEAAGRFQNWLRSLQTILADG